MKPDLFSDPKPTSRRSSQRMVLGVVALALALNGGAWIYVSRFRQGAAPAEVGLSREIPTGVSALGYLQPEGEVIHLSAPMPPNGAGSRVEQLLVREGEWVEQGATIAILDNFERLQAAVTQAETRVEVARARLAQVQAGAKAGELEAQRATIAQLQADLRGQLSVQGQQLSRLQATLNHAQAEYDRYQDLFNSGAISASQLDSNRLSMVTAQEQWHEAQAQRDRVATTLQAQIQAAQATLSQLAEVRPTEVQGAQAELESAIADVAKARADLNLTHLRAPTAGQILAIHTRAGEMVGPQGVVALGQTQQMAVIAEVYELDVGRVQVGQRATITANALPSDLQGEVMRVGVQINRQNVLSTDPVADVDQRIVEVKIQLDPSDSQRVAALTNLQVNVVIDTYAQVN